MCRVICFFAIFFIFHSVVYASDSTLIWKHASYKEMLTEAKKSGKNIMICLIQDSSDVGKCYMDIRKVLSTNRMVGYFLNEHFSNYTINPLIGEGIELNKRFNLKHYPAFIYLDTSGNLVHKLVGYYNQNIFLEESNKALSKKCSYSYLKFKYETYKKTPDILLNYCYALRCADEEDSARICPIINEYLNTQSFSDFRKNINIKFIYDFSVVNYNAMLSFDSKPFMFLYNHEDIFRKYYNKSDIDIRIVWTLTDNIEIVKNKKDEKGFKKIISLLKKYDKGKEWDWKDKKGGIVAWIPFTHLVAWETLLFYESYGNRGKFDSAFSNYIKYIWNVSDDLNDLAWTYYQNIDDNYKLQLAIKCVKRSIEIRTNANNFDTYAMLLYKTGSYKEALSQEELALDDAKKSKKDIKPFSDKIQLIKKSLK